MLAGKGFLDMRQNERRIEFIRTGDGCRTVGQLKGEPTPFVGLQPIFIASGQRKFLWRGVALGNGHDSIWWLNMKMGAGWLGTG